MSMLNFFSLLYRINSASKHDILKIVPDLDTFRVEVLYQLSGGFSSVQEYLKNVVININFLSLSTPTTFCFSSTLESSALQFSYEYKEKNLDSYSPSIPDSLCASSMTSLAVIAPRCHQNLLNNAS